MFDIPKAESGMRHVIKLDPREGGYIEIKKELYKQAHALGYGVRKNEIRPHAQNGVAFLGYYDEFLLIPNVDAK